MRIKVKEEFGYCLIEIDGSKHRTGSARVVEMLKCLDITERGEYEITVRKVEAIGRPILLKEDQQICWQCFMNNVGDIKSITSCWSCNVLFGDPIPAAEVAEMLKVEADES